MKTQFAILAVGALMLAGSIYAQSNDESKITIEITKDINGEKKTFKGEYNSTEEMHADPNYQEFAGNDNDFNFHFNGDENQEMFFHLDQLMDSNKSFFKFFHGDEQDDHTFSFKHFDEDDFEDGFLNLQLDGMDLDEYKEHMKELGIEMDELFERLHEKDDDGRVRIIEIKRVKITDVDDEFGEKGKVDASQKLTLDDLNFYPNPSSDGRFKVRFSVPEDKDLSIKVSNLEGKEVFSRYFERFGGTYSEMIDLSGQKEGIYLMEISQGKKRLTKKIVIN